jgi:DNA-binding NarL/FixJ family response regulator
VSGFSASRVYPEERRVAIGWVTRDSTDRFQEAPASGRPRTVRLTGRERDIVDLLLEGCTNKVIALRLGVSVQTVKNQLSALYRKAGVRTRLQLVVRAQRGRL